MHHEKRAKWAPGNTYGRIWAFLRALTRLGRPSPRPGTGQIRRPSGQGREMQHLLLERMPTTATETQGFLSFDSEVLLTIERPWIPADTPGGLPFESCVPDGRYKLIPHQRPEKENGTPGDEVVALVNESLGVYYLADDRPNGVGRYLILCHISNWSFNVVGCIAPGLSKGPSAKGPMVKSSKAAMRRLMSYIADDDAELEIRWIT